MVKNLKSLVWGQIQRVRYVVRDIVDNYGYPYDVVTSPECGTL